MNISDYKPKSIGDFEILVDRFIATNRNNKLKPDNYSKEDHLKEIMIECFKMGLKAGQMPCNKPIDLKSMCNNAV